MQLPHRINMKVTLNFEYQQVCLKSHGNGYTNPPVEQMCWGQRNEWHSLGLFSNECFSVRRDI